MIFSLPQLFINRTFVLAIHCACTKFITKIFYTFLSVLATYSPLTYWMPQYVWILRLNFSFFLLFSVCFWNFKAKCVILCWLISCTLCVLCRMLSNLSCFSLLRGSTFGSPFVPQCSCFYIYFLRPNLVEAFGKYRSFYSRCWMCSFSVILAYGLAYSSSL